jgi:hypothetical protein
MSAKDYLWSELTRKNPRLLEDPHFTPASMRKFFDRVYEAGWNDGYKSSRCTHKHSSEIFSSIFGGKL